MWDSKLLNQNNMKILNKYLIISFLTVTLGLIGCQKGLDLVPAQDIAEEVALDSDENVKAVLIGAYDRLSNDDLLAGYIQLSSELLGADGEIRWAGTFTAPREIFSKQILTNNANITATWLDAYNTINVANNVLSAIDVVDADDQDRVEGEALFIRGISYFYLALDYTKPYASGDVNDNGGLPLILTPTRGVNDGSFVSRSSRKATWDQIKADLQAAVNLLPEENPNSFLASKVTAQAFLSRVYLQLGEYQNALTTVNDAITLAESLGMGLVSSYANAFNNASNTQEDVFAIQVNTQDGTNIMNLFFSIPDFGGRDGDVDILDKHLDQYEAGDEGLDLFFEGAGQMRTGKWNNQFGVVNIIRMAELYLIRAECNRRLGSAVGATPDEDVNLIRERAGLTPLTNATLDQILQERKLELAFEGIRSYDIKRLQLSADGFAWDSDDMTFPIPQREIDANPNLSQNPGY
jgi:tetratricopeptide (TPR) repeat protein